jgi:hypothetical protein
LLSFDGFYNPTSARLIFADTYDTLIPTLPRYIIAYFSPNMHSTILKAAVFAVLAAASMAAPAPGSGDVQLAYRDSALVERAPVASKHDGNGEKKHDKHGGKDGKGDGEKKGKKHGHEDKKHGHEDKKHGHEDKKHGHEDKKHGHEDKKHGHEDKKHGHEDKKHHKEH